MAETRLPFQLTCRSPSLAVVAVAVLAIGVALTAARTIVQYQTPGPFDPSAQGMCDFHNGIFFPTTALQRGISPYGEEYAAEYPVARQIPFFSPGILVLHAPWTWLPLHVAETTYFVFSLVLVFCISVVCLDAAGLERRLEWVAAVAAAIVFSRGGHITLFDGYFTFELVLATLLSIRWAPQRPLLAAIALMIVSAKPTFILPLGLLMLARGDFKALLWGAVLSIIAAIAPLTWLAYHEGMTGGAVDLLAGFEQVVSDIRGAQEVHMGMEDESPQHSWTRLDLLAVVCKWIGREPGQLIHLGVMDLLIAPPMLMLYRRFRAGVDDGVGGMTGALILIAMLTSLYHQSYDALVLFAPLVGVLAARNQEWSESSAAFRWILGLLLATPLFNYLSTRMILSRLDFGDTFFRIATSINGVVLSIALVMVLVKSFRIPLTAKPGG